MVMPSLGVVGTIVDIGVVAVAMSLFVYALSQGYLKSQEIPSQGAILIMGGLVLAMFAHVFDPLVQLMRPADANTLEGFTTSYLTSERFNWLASRLAFALIAVGLLIAVLHRKRLETSISEVRAEAEEARQSEQLKESRLRYLFSTTTDSVYCFRFDPPMPTALPVDEQIEWSYGASLEDCNVRFAEEFGAADPGEIVGMKVSDLESSKDEEAHHAWFRTFVENGYKLNNYDMAYTDLGGIDRALYINMIGDVHDGQLHRMWAVENNVLAMRLTTAKLKRRDQFQKVLADISSRLVKVADEEADEEVSACLGEACRYVGAERSFMFWLNRATGQAEITHFCNSGGNPFGATVPMGKFPRFLTELAEGRNVRIDDSSALPDEARVDRESLVGFGIKSLLVLPLTLAGEVVGGMTMGRTLEQRDWTDQDVKEVKVIAELFASFVLRLKSRRALDDALSSLQRATDRLEAENVYLREEVELSHGFDDIIGQSRSVLRSLQQVEQVAPTRATVLVTGETGTGKELIARAIHELSDRKDRPLVKVNCAALPTNLVESELFGYEKGAFTSADSSKRGRFDLANGSTLFLDEIGEIPIELQAKLLRVLQEGEFERLGGTKTVKVDVRLVVATNRDLGEAVADGSFRSDLYYRINTFPIDMPALRERGDDIQLLAEHFVKTHSQRLAREITEISAEMMRQLRLYPWPGNVRELEGIVQRALISSRGPVLRLAEPLIVDKDPVHRIIGTTIADLKIVERDHILSVLDETDWRISGQLGAAAQLGIPPSTLRSKMKKLAIERPQ